MSRVCLLALAALLACEYSYEDVPAAPLAVGPGVTATEGDRAILRCLFSSNSPPKITWTFREKIIDSDAGRHTQMPDGLLVINPVQSNDAGTYICNADNGHGVARQQVFLDVNVPDPTEKDCPGSREEYENALNCEYGMRNSTLEGCIRYHCIENPCNNMNCSSNHYCELYKRTKAGPHGDLYSADCVNECDAYEITCDIHCDFGVENTPDGGENLCDKCKCKPSPCNTTSCPEGSRCVLQSTPLDNNEIQFSPECETVEKAGVCPANETSPQNNTCHRECNDDADCRGAGKCCSRGCSFLCLAPVQLTSMHCDSSAFAPGLKTGGHTSTQPPTTKKTVVTTASATTKRTIFDPSLCENSLRPYEPYPTDCTKYYDCAPSGSTLKSCSPGTMYNNVTMVCDWSYNVLVIRPECDGTTSDVLLTKCLLRSMRPDRAQQVLNLLYSPEVSSQR